MSASTTTKKTKKVRYEPGTKGSPHTHTHTHHHHRSSRDRDSGVGSSSTSGRASLGTTPNPPTTSPNETQRHDLGALQEALDAANEKIRQYEAQTEKLKQLLSESHKENRLLKRERAEWCERAEDLLDDLEDERAKSEQLRRGAGSSSRVSPPPRASPRLSREMENRAATASSGRLLPRLQMYPADPRPPLISAPNPFLPSPRDSWSGAPGVGFVPERVLQQYPASSVLYATLPSAHAPLPSRGSRGYEGSGSGSVVNDGRYHLSPV